MGLAALRLEERVAEPVLRRPGVDRLGDDVVVAHQQEGLLERQTLLRMGLEPAHPGELVGELVGADRVAVGQVEAADADDAGGDRDHRFDVAGLGVVGVAGQAAGDVLEPVLRQDGDAVEALLTVGGDVVAEALEGGEREALVDRLDLLQADEIGPRLLQPGEERVDAGLDTVDVPGHELHGDSRARGFGRG